MVGKDGKKYNEHGREKQGGNCQWREGGGRTLKGLEAAR